MNPRIAVLQTAALPLGYVTFMKSTNDYLSFVRLRPIRRSGTDPSPRPCPDEYRELACPPLAGLSGRILPPTKLSFPRKRESTTLKIIAKKSGFYKRKQFCYNVYCLCLKPKIRQLNFYFSFNALIFPDTPCRYWQFYYYSIYSNSNIFKSNLSVVKS